MNHFKRFLLLVFALAVGGGMGYRLLVGFNFVKIPKPGAQRVLLADVAVDQQPDFF